MSVLQQLTAAPVAKANRSSKTVDKAYRWTPKKMDSARKAGAYLRLGFETIPERSLSGAELVWNAGPKNTSAVPYAKQTAIDPETGRPRRNPAVGKGLDVVYLPGFAVNNQRVNFYVTGKWVHIRTFLQGPVVAQVLGGVLSADDAKQILATEAYGVHTVLPSLPRELSDQASELNAYGIMVNDLQSSVPGTNPPTTYLQLAEQSRQRLTRAFYDELATLSGEKRRKKKIDAMPGFDLSLFIVLSGSIRQGATFKDANGQEISRSQRGTTPTRKPLDQRLREFLATNDDTKLFKISGYPDKATGPSKRPEKDSKRSRLVGIPFTFDGKDMSTIVFTNDVKSVVPALTDLGVNKQAATSAAMIVKGRIDDRDRKENVVAPPIYVGFTQQQQGPVVTAAQSMPLVERAPEMTLVPVVSGQPAEEAVLALPSAPAASFGQALPLPQVGSGGVTALPPPLTGPAGVAPLPPLFGQGTLPLPSLLQ